MKNILFHKKRYFDAKEVPDWFNLKENLFFKIDSS